jgi:hypothetical protein
MWIQRNYRRLSKKLKDESHTIRSLRNKHSLNFIRVKSDVIVYCNKTLKRWELNGGWIGDFTSLWNEIDPNNGQRIQWVIVQNDLAQSRCNKQAPGLSALALCLYGPFHPWYEAPLSSSIFYARKPEQCENIGCPKTREHLRTNICLSNRRIRTFQAEPDRVKWQKKTIFIFVSVNFQLKLFIELDVGLRNSGPRGKWTKI